VIPYGRQSIDRADIAAVDDVLRSAWLTTGPKVAEFEVAFAKEVGAAHGVAVSSGTAALHASMHAIGIGPGDEVLVPAMTFAASANAVVYEGGTPVFVDVGPDTLLVDADEIEARITPATRAVVAVDYAGQPCDYDKLRDVCSRHGVVLVADACHALGARDRDRAVGSLADLNVFSFHPVKHVATGEGGMVTTDNSQLAERMYRFRNHGISSDHRSREAEGTWFYEMVELGYNYRLTDIQCALGLSQLDKLEVSVARRRDIAARYDEAFGEVDLVAPLSVRPEAHHAYHLYVIRLDLDRLRASRAEVYTALRTEGIGVNVHYIPVHLHPFYRNRFGTGPGLCPVAEDAYERIISIPMFPAMADEDVERVVGGVRTVVGRLAA
jgi:perosamine synthetase